MPLLQKFEKIQQTMQQTRSYQPIKEKSGKMVLTSEQARNIDEDFPMENSSHEFDHKPSLEDIRKADFINNKMKKMKKESQNRNAVKDLNKVIESAKSPLDKVKCGSPYKMKYQSPLNFKGANSKNSKCWDGYKKVGTKKSPSGTGETVNDCVKE